jgi:hypothetical protein
MQNFGTLNEMPLDNISPTSQVRSPPCYLHSKQNVEKGMIVGWLQENKVYTEVRENQ